METWVPETCVILLPPVSAIMANVIEDATPLRLDTLPARYVDRADEQRILATALTTGSPHNYHLHGHHGSGKTHLVQRLLRESEATNTCYVSCKTSDTQYKVLRRLHETVTDDAIGSGYHASDLQRTIAQRTEAVRTILVLDDVGFLLLNDGDDLLYFLSRLDHSSNVTVVAISTERTDLAEALDDRVYSTLAPQEIHFDRYSEDVLTRILLDRAQESLEPRSLQQKAVTTIAAATANAAFALVWLRTAAEHADAVVTESTVTDARVAAQHRYVDHLLDPFTEHHHLLYQAIDELAVETEPPVTAGAIYDRYDELCSVYSVDRLSDRRLSDFLKHLELLELVRVEYHYGGEKGKTRDVEPVDLANRGDR